MDFVVLFMVNLSYFKGLLWLFSRGIWVGQRAQFFILKTVVMLGGVRPLGPGYL